MIRKFFRMLGERLNDLIAKIISMKGAGLGIATALLAMDKLDQGNWVLVLLGIMGCRTIEKGAGTDFFTNIKQIFSGPGRDNGSGSEKKNPVPKTEPGKKSESMEGQKNRSEVEPPESQVEYQEKENQGNVSSLQLPENFFIFQDNPDLRPAIQKWGCNLLTLIYIPMIFMTKKIIPDTINDLYNLFLGKYINEMCGIIASRRLMINEIFGMYNRKNKIIYNQVPPPDFIVKKCTTPYTGKGMGEHYMLQYGDNIYDPGHGNVEIIGEPQDLTRFSIVAN